jgi:hypothetical protein
VSFCDDDCAHVAAVRGSGYEEGKKTYRVSLSDIFANIGLGCYQPDRCEVARASVVKFESEYGIVSLC